MNFEENKDLAHRQHLKYFMRFLNVLPSSLSAHDSTRMTIAYFSVAGLDILGSISTLNSDMKSRIIDWIYRLQVHPNKETGDMSMCGFQGSSSINIELSPETAHYRCGHLAMTYTGLSMLVALGDDLSKINRKAMVEELSPETANYRCGHLAMTYTGLSMLVALGDDLSKINRKAMVEGVAALQREEGNFAATLSGCESDMRFVYCAACISYILHDWSGLDVDKTTNFIINSFGYDYGIAQGPELESHGGTTFCALASLSLMDQMDKLTEAQVEGLKRWLIFRQIDGFQGRPNKPVDTCYSFWVGASLKILDTLKFSNYGSNRKYVYDTQDIVVGGFSKWPDTCTDPMHTYLGLAGLSLIGESGLLEIEPRLNITNRAFEHLKKLHEKWDSEL